MNTLIAQKGMTLIEIMISVAIIAIIGAMAIPAYTNYVRTGKANVCIDEAKNIMLAEEEFFNIPAGGNTYFIGDLTAGNLGSLPAASTGLYRPSPRATDNCEYNVILTPTGYSLSIDGINDLAVEGAAFFVFNN